MKIYLLLGTNLPEIRTCISQLAQQVEDPDPPVVYLPEGLEGTVEGCGVEAYAAEDALWVFDPDQQGTVFIVIDPRREVIAQLENLAEDLKKCLIEPVKVVTFVDCARAEAESRLRAWLEACIYYSDLVLLGNRSTASKSFLRDYQKDFQRRCYPCRFLLLKGDGIPSEPEEILVPGERRLSQLFDLRQPQAGEALPGVVIEASCDLEMEEEEHDPYRMPDGDNPPTPVPVPAEFVQS